MAARRSPLGHPGSFGRRLLVLLLVAAPVPLALLGLISLSQFESRLREETDKRLIARSKDASLEVYRRLADLDATLGGEQSPEWRLAEDRMAPPWRRKLRSVFDSASPDDPPPHPGAPELDEAQRKRLLEGGGVLAVGRDPLRRPSLWLVRPRARSSTAVVWAEIEVEWLWPMASVTPQAGTDWVLLDGASGEVLATSPAAPPKLLRALDTIHGQSAGGLGWRDAQGSAHRARYWTVPLGFEFAHPGLKTLVSEADPVVPPVAALRRSLVLGGSAALLVAALFVARRLSADLEPLVTLTDATHRLEQGELTARVKVAGPSDLMRLGNSFNRMAEGLERQFHLLEASHEVALAALEREPNQVEIALLFITRLRPLLPSAELIVALRGSQGRSVFVVGGDDAESPDAIQVETAGTIPARVLDADGWIGLDADDSFPPIGPRRTTYHWRALRRGVEVLGAIGVSSVGGSPRISEEFLRHFDAPGSQLALALSRARFLDDQERANWGILSALARAVDAKSPWTQGHSERVARIAVAMALELELSGSDIRIVRRGSLLHDVGKIGVPSAVLDKPGKLDAEELAMLQTHVEKGARILEPLEGFSDVLKIVWQHHERLDGSGYPKGLKGDGIDWFAGLVAVADVFEALTAARPYREAQLPDQTLAYLRRLAGIQFDERSVASLERLRETSGHWPFLEQS